MLYPIAVPYGSIGVPIPRPHLGEAKSQETEGRGGSRVDPEAEASREGASTLVEAGVAEPSESGCVAAETRIV